MSNHSTGFWNGGHNAVLKALRQEEAERVLPLKQALKSESDPEVKGKLEDEIRQIQAEFKSKRKAAGSSLFIKA